MSFLSRKPARTGSRDGGAGRDDEYDDYDEYALDGYQNEDDGWSPGEYFSPEGIKGRWAGERPEGRAGGRGQRDSRGDDSYEDGFDGPEYGGAPANGGGTPRGDTRAGYGADEYAAGAYDLPEGADEDRQERSRRRRRDREDRGERTGILRLRRDRGEDIWPDDGISDEDYWASVAADRPLNAGDAGPKAAPRAGAAGPDSRFGELRSGDQRGGDQRGSDQRGGDQRGVTGRLGPPPGLAGDYQPAGAPGGSLASGAGGAGGRAGQPGGRPGSGPMPARPGSGPMPARPGTGPTPTVGVTSSRPPSGPNRMRPGSAGGPGSGQNASGPSATGPGAAWQGQANARPASGSGGFPQAAPRPSFQPNGYQPGAPAGSGPASGGHGGGSPAGGRQQDRGDWDRTERIERVNASGYPDQRPAARFQGAPVAPSPASSGRGRDDGARADGGRADGDPWRTPREPARDGGRDTGGWSPAARGPAPAHRGADDDPLTSNAYSRSALAETDGRSYRVAARRSQAQTKLTDQAETFITGQYQSGSYGTGYTGDYPTASFQPADQRTDQRSGDYRQYRGDATATGGQPRSGQTPTGQYPAYGGQPGYQSQPGRGGESAGRPGSAGGQYDVQQSRPSQQHTQSQHRPPGQPGQPGQAQAAAGGVPAGGRSPAGDALNPYDAGITGSYPYPGQSYPARPAAAGSAQDGADDRYYRPSPQDGRAAGQSGVGHSGVGQSGAGQSGAGQGVNYRTTYPAPPDRRY